MRFGYFIRPGVTYKGMLTIAKKAEELGYHGIYLNDHVMGLMNEAKMPFLEATTTLAAIGVKTSRVRLGHITLFNQLRNPALLAKTVTTLDHIFEGRYDVILGAGWMRQEYEGYDLTGDGKGVPEGYVRADQLRETLKILRGMLANPEFSYTSRYWKLVNAYNYPQPVQQHMPIIVGGSKPRLVKLAVKYADGLNVLTVGGGLGSIRDARKLLDPELEKKGKTLDTFELSAFDHTVWLYETDDDYTTAAKKIAESRKRPIEDVKSDLFMGTAETLIDKIRTAEDLGVKLIIIYVRPTGDLEVALEKMTAFRDEVIRRI